MKGLVSSEEERNALVLSCLDWVRKLAWSYAKRYNACHLIEDLVQEGNLGLLKAASKFDPRRGIRFITYATCWIKQGIVRFLVDRAHAVRLSEFQHNKVLRLRRISDELERRLGRTPTKKEIIASGVDPKVFSNSAPLLNFQVVSLDSPSQGQNRKGRGKTFQEVIPACDGAKAFLEKLEGQETKGLILSLAAKVYQGRQRARNLKIFALHFALLDGNDPQGFEALGRKFGISRQAAEQIVKKVLRDHRFRWGMEKQFRVRFNSNT